MRPKCVFSETGLQWYSGWGRGVSSERGWEGVLSWLSWLPWWGGGRGGQVLPRILVTCPGSQGTSCPCSLFMTRVEVPGSSFMLCLGPGPPSLLHLTRANAEKPYEGDTPSVHVKTLNVKTSDYLHSKFKLIQVGDLYQTQATDQRSDTTFLT
jgi:hypothetical protein